MGARMSQFDEDVLVVVHTINAVEKLMQDLGCATPAGSKSQWKVDPENSRVVEMYDSTWIQLEGPNDQDYPDPVTDWIALFNPLIIDGFLQMMRDHIVGLQELRFSNPELADQLSVSRTVLGVAKQLQDYVVCVAQIDEDGTILRPTRRLSER